MLVVGLEGIGKRERYTQGRYELANCLPYGGSDGSGRHEGSGRRECWCGHWMRRGSGRLRGGMEVYEELTFVVMMVQWCGSRQMS